MNIMRKLWVTSNDGETSGQTPSSSSATSHHQHQPISLACMHLRKLYGEYSHVHSEALLYNMLPLFCKLFNNLSYAELHDRFPETVHFTSSISRQLVLELRKRATNSPTVEAALSIIEFLEPNERDDDQSHGFMLISTLNLLSTTDEQVIEIMCNNSVPSTLVKCLYLFFDLPPPSSSPREMVQRVFVQVLIRLCSHACVSEELANKDDLALLFSCVSSWCATYNVGWRKAAADVLMSVSTHGLTPQVLSYIHNKACICLCVDNLRRGGSSSNQSNDSNSNNQVKTEPSHLTPIEVTEMVFTLFCFLKDSASLSQVLLDDFKSSQGYNFLIELILKLEEECEENELSVESIKNVMLVVTSLTTCGHTVLKPNPQNTATPFTLPDFQVPSTPTKCSSIRNLHAFGILPSVFTKANTNIVSTLVLDSISSIFRADKQNYFIVDSFLPQMAEKLCTKSVETQIKYLDIIEFLVFELNFTPCKELIALSRVLKNHTALNNVIMFKLLVIKTLVKLIKQSSLFKDVYREIGILEVALSCVKEESQTQDPQTLHLSNDLMNNTLELISMLINSNTSNLAIFREHNTAVKLLQLSHDSTRNNVYSILSVCFVSQGGEEELVHALVRLQKNSNESVIAMLGLFISCFRESHRARCNFRKAGGFLYLMSLLVAMEGSFASDHLDNDQVQDVIDKMKIFQLIFSSFCLAMRFEPANAKLFQQEICLPSLADTIRLLSHVTNVSVLTKAASLSLLESCSPESRINEYHKIFTSNDVEFVISQPVPLPVALTLFTYRVLYDLALDNFDKQKSKSESVNMGSPAACKRLNLHLTVPDPVIVHSGVVVIMIRLLPSVKNINDFDIDSCLCQLYCAELVKSLVRSERNQQIMAGVGVCTEILDKLHLALNDENSIIHTPLQYVFERVATQALSPGELRKFLRLGNPLNCNREVYGTMHEQVTAGSNPVPLSRVKTLVSMTTPRSNSNESSMISSSCVNSTSSPSFVEFDMSAEGFGCLFIPSLGAGVAYSQDFVVQSASLLSSGIGANSTTLCYSTWFCVDKFSDAKADPHPVRLLSLIKESSNGVQRLCLSVLLSARDRAIIISTKETGLPPPGIGDWEPDVSTSSSHSVRVWFPDIHEGVWTHALVCFHANNMSVFLNGRNVHTCKLESPQRSKHSVNHTYSAFIGTPPMWRKASRLCWKQGVSHLFEDFVVNQNTAYCVWKLGPSYLGSWQSVRIIGEGIGENALVKSPVIGVNGDPTILIPEEKLVFGLNAIAVSQLTLQKIRKLYSKSDAKAIAKQLGLSSHENATPINMLHNSAAHLMGPPRPIGGICIGYLGVRLFNPNPVYKSVFSIGGIRILISLIALANTGETLYASLKACVCVLKNSNIRVDKGEAQVIGFVLKNKKSLLTMRVLHLVFSLVDQEHGFAELLGDLEIWCGDGKINDLEKALYEHFMTLLNEDKRAVEYFKSAGVLNNLLSRTTVHTHNSLFAVIGILVKHELVVYGCFVVDTLPTEKIIEKNLDNKIIIRNKCLQLIHACLYVGRTINVQFCEELVNTLGFDFLLLFSEPNLHPNTLVWALRILMLVLNSSQNSKTKFRDGIQTVFCFNKHAINHANKTLGTEYACLGLKREVSKLEDNPDSPTNGGFMKSRVATNLVGGWVRLTWALAQRIMSENPNLDVEVWLLICASVLGQGVRNTLPFTKYSQMESGEDERKEESLTLDLIWQYVFPSSPQSPTTSLYGKVSLCSDAIISLLTLTRCHIHNNGSTDVSNTITQFLCFLYSNTPEFQCIFTSVDILTGLSLSIMPIESLSDDVFEDEEADKPETVSETFKDTPAKKIILDFLRIIIIDWMNTQGGNQKPNQNVVVDTVLDAAATCIHDQAVVADFNTRLLGTLLDHLIACDIDHIFRYVNAVAGFISRLVDKIWQDSFERDPIVVLDFLVTLVNASRTRRSVSAGTIDSLYHSLNRVILYVLSRKQEQTAENWQIVEVLKKLRNIRTTVFSPHNHAQEFFGCLTYVLVQLDTNVSIQLDVNTTTKFYVSMDTPTTPKAITSEISSTAGKLWEALYVCKKPILEELFKITFPSADPPPLSIIKDQVFDTAVKFWLAYLANELSAKKSSVSSHQSWEIHQQLQSKIQKVTGGLRSFARSSIRKELSVDKDLCGAAENRLKRNLIDSWTDAKKLQSIAWRVVAGVKETKRTTEKMRENDYIHLKRFVCDSLLPRLEAEVTRERGVWGPYTPGKLDKWMLDNTEGPCRMRKKLLRNDLFYVHYGYVPTSSRSTSSPSISPKLNKRVNAPVSRDSYEYYKTQANIPIFEYEQETGVQETTSEGTTRSPLTSTSSCSSNTEDDEGVQDPETHSTVLFRLIENQHEKISQIFRVAQIQGLESVEGLLLFGKDHVYLISGFTILTKTREIKDMYYLPSGSYDPILPPQCYGNVNKRTRMHDCFKLAYDDVREVLKRRYLLQPIALEIFCSDGRNYLLAFPRKIRNVVFAKFTNFSKLSDSGTADAKQSVAGQKRTTNVEERGLFSSLIGETSVTQRWVRGEISNFQYLMHLNTLAGRSYNDLMQYPVFPWILANYDSPYVDLSDPKTFRDLSKPMGAQTPGRLVQFVKRYKEWDDPHGETPPYHYGTHYSSAMIVCSYLVRMEPFAQHFLRLQGGHFDLADRMFHSIKEAWTSASKHNMADVKELIPEFFYLPEFLLNSNNFDLGNKQNGTPLNDVVLPPWAKNDAREFIRVHRMALECDYVSQHLHEWIDLIFGYKQQGQPAVDAVNVFHHLFYEGNVDIYNIDDPLKKNATIGFINNFGQIPKQLFKRPHPAKKCHHFFLPNQRPYSSILDGGGNLISALGGSTDRNVMQSVGNLVSVGFGGIEKEKFFYHAVDLLRPTATLIKELKGPVGQILPLDNKPNSILAVEQNKALMGARSYVSWGFADCSLRVCHVDSDRPTLICELTQNVDWNGEVVACAVANEKIFVTGQTNSVVCVWEVSQYASTSGTPLLANNSGSYSNMPSISLKSSLHGHSEGITCLAVSLVYNIVLSGSKDRSCVIWDLARYDFTRQLPLHDSAIDAVAINDCSGDLASADGCNLRLWSINGDPLAIVDTSMNSSVHSTVLCIAFSTLNDWDADNVVVTGSTDGIVRFWSLAFIQDRGQNVDSESDDESSRDKDPDKDEDEFEEARKREIHISKRGSLRGSKSEGNLSDDGGFEVLTEREIANAFALPPGSVWKRQLAFRGKLTLHTSYERKDNIEPAAITSLGVARDHKSLYVGDARGRVYGWSVSDSSGGGRADHWVRDEASDSCTGCSLKFTITERKHHCRNCGQVFCAKCSRFESEIFRLKILKPVRVCEPCFVNLKGKVTPAT
ncbi:unnamed protein product [Orchesella dallaii]|uniref:WD repeat and FYVE domain-containing protein 3 n=1 Tax=Orchesella dallaii TaxID=48710 RepID=A0ABP1QZI8_9HEXA